MRLPERIECTRAEYAIALGIWPDPDVIGICEVNEDRTEVVREYVFIDEPFKPKKFLRRKDLIEIGELYQLWYRSFEKQPGAGA